MRGFFDIEVDRKRVFGLDLLRAFAIFCVVHGHGERLLYDTRLNCFTDLPLPHGVDIFFVMSGFLIGKSLLSYMQKHDESLDRQKIFSFYLRTALRILPNYLFILIVNYILVESHVIQGNTQTFSVWYFVTFTQNLFTPFWDFYWESWSLPVQWWFYIFFPLFLVLLSRFAQPKKYIPWLCLFFVVFSITFRLSVADHVTNRFSYDVWMRKTVASRIENIYIGVLAAWLMHYFPKQWKRYGILCFILGIALFAATRIIPRNLGSFYHNAVYLTISALSVGLWVPLLTRWKSYKTAVGGFISRISILSYAMFLTNSLVILTMDTVCPQFMHHHGVLAYGVYWIVVLAVSYLLHILVEKPFVQLRERIK